MASTSTDNRDDLVTSHDPEHPANMICELCRDFYKLGWVTGTGGGTYGPPQLTSRPLMEVLGISIKHGEHVYLAPSGVQKERIKPEHIFVLPFAQSSVPKPGSQRDFLRIPQQAVRTLGHLLYANERLVKYRYTHDMWVKEAKTDFGF